MRDIRNICLIDTQPVIANALEKFGCSVHRIPPSKELFFDLPAALDQEGFKPDLVVQTEILRQRRIVLGLDQMECPTIFWALDPHLNAYWHSAYARLFDVTCSTQQREIPSLKSRGAADVRSLPIFGQAQPFVDMATREHPVAFVGRVTEQRPARQWMVRFLETKLGKNDFFLRDNLTAPEMLALYRNTRIVPNESILGEINFRLFEAASCGCLVLSQDLGAEQVGLFEPGREFDTYADVVELDEKLSMYRGNDRLVQAMGRAAWERVQAEHLPRHRARRLLEYARDAARNRATGPDGAKWTALTVAAMWEGRLAPLSADRVLSRLASLEQDADVVAATLMVQSTAGKKRLVADNINTILAGELYADSLDVNLCGSMAALRADEWDLAKTFWYRHMQAVGDSRTAPPKSPEQLLTLWAKVLKKCGRIMRGGFQFDPESNLPASATDCLFTILSEKMDDLPTLRLLDAMLRPLPGMEQARVGFLSVLTLHDRKDWRAAFEIALVNLKSYRLESGLEELLLARGLACEQGQERAFAMALAARDVSGQIARRLG